MPAIVIGIDYNALLARVVSVGTHHSTIVLGHCDTRVLRCVSTLAATGNNA